IPSELRSGAAVDLALNVLVGTTESVTQAAQVPVVARTPAKAPRSATGPVRSTGTGAGHGDLLRRHRRIRKTLAMGLARAHENAANPYRREARPNGPTQRWDRIRIPAPFLRMMAPGSSGL